MEGKKSFVLYCDIIHTIAKLSDEKAGELFKHILKYVNDENPKADDPLIEIAFEPIKQALKRDLIKWKNKSEANRINGSKGGRPKNPKNPVGYLVTENNRAQPKKADIVIDSVIDSDSVGNKRFTPPTFQQVREYEIEKNYTNKASRFIDFYESKGWMVGKNKMKNWKAARRNWSNDEKPKTTTV